MHACAMQTIDYDSIEEKEAKDAPVDVATDVVGNSDAVDEPIAEVLDKVSVCGWIFLSGPL